jgi:hypothetical protein
LTNGWGNQHSDTRFASGAGWDLKCMLDARKGVFAIDSTRSKKFSFNVQNSKELCTSTQLLWMCRGVGDGGTGRYVAGRGGMDRYFKYLACGASSFSLRTVFERIRPLCAQYLRNTFSLWTGPVGAARSAECSLCAPTMHLHVQRPALQAVRPDHWFSPPLISLCCTKGFPTRPL